MNINELAQHIIKNNRHDSVFKLAMHDIKVAQDMIKHYLPERIVKQLKLETLTLSNSSYIDKDLSATHADILYRAKTKSQNDAFIYFLWEHQSTYDPQMPLRIYRYIGSIMHDHMKSGAKHLPIVIPALVYNGEQTPYPGSCDIYDSFADPTFARKNMFKPFSLLDLSTKTEEELMQAKWCALPNMILKHMRARDFMNAIQSTLTPLITFLYQNNGEDVAQSMLRCIIELTDAENVGALIKATYRSSKETGDAMTTAYEYLIKKGLKEGIDLGRQEGIDLGRQEGIDLGRQEGIDLGKKMAEKEAESKLIKTLLTAGFDEHKVASLVGTSVEDVQRVQLSLAAQA